MRRLLSSRRSTLVILVVLLLALTAIPAFAQDVERVATNFLADLQGVLQGIALAAAVMSLLTLWRVQKEGT